MGALASERLRSSQSEPRVAGARSTKANVQGEAISGEYVGAKPVTMPDGSDAQINPVVKTL
jgi:hypothetical protein